MKMQLKHLFRAGFRHYLKANFWVALGVAVSTAVLTGGLVVGDSVRYSLRQGVEARLGEITHAIVSGERFFTQDLAERLNNNGLSASAALNVSGMASVDGGRLELNQVTVWGLDDRFADVSGANIHFDDPNSVYVSENTALRLNLNAGDELLLRIEKGSLLPANAPFVSAENQTNSQRFTVAQILTSEQLSRLNLQNAQTAPYNIFLPIAALNQLSEMDARANVLFVKAMVSKSEVEQMLFDSWTLEDAALQVVEAPADGAWELRSPRVFLDEAVQQLVENTGLNFTPILTYFANSFKLNDLETPYSFVSSLPDNQLNEGEVVINSWLAEDLKATVGDSITLTYFEIGPLRELTEVAKKFQVVAIQSITGYFADRMLMPEIPGLSDSENCRDWDTGVPVNLKSIRAKDEAYWYEYRGLPKAYVAYSEAVRMWGNRFGTATAYRFSQTEIPEDQLIQNLTAQLDPFSFDLQVKDVRNEGFMAADNGTDFSSLFIGLSFFILMSGLILTALLFVFNMEKRKSEVGTLAALGFQPKTILKLFLMEGLAISALGALFGVGLSVLYNELVFIGLNRVWNDIVRTDVLMSHYCISTLLIGWGASVLVSLGVIFMVLRRYLKRNLVQLQRKQQQTWLHRNRTIWKLLLVSLLFVGFLPVLMRVFYPQLVGTSAFFIAGGALLIASVLFAALILTRRVEAKQGRVGISNLVFQNLRQNRSRSLMVIILLAIGTYLVVSTGMNRKDFFAKLADKQSGTGGFLFWAESTVPILHNLNDLQYRQEQGFVEDFKVVQFHIAQGDDASCLNLNRIANPRVLGVDSDLLQGRFSFQTKLNSINDESDLWPELQRDYGDCVPAIADQTVILWSLGKMVGDTLLYRNSLGNDVKLLLIGGLAPSVFQGNVLIDNQQFLKHFPTTSGSSVFLVEGHPEQQEAIADELLLTYRDSGWEMTLTAERLALFNSIERTYLTIFLILGAFGLLIGTFGLAIVLQRSVLDRKAELALLQAVGFGRKQILGILLSEFSLLLVYGILVGFVSALVSVWPSVGLQFQDVSLGFVGILMLVIVANGLFWIVIIAKSQLKKLKLVEALRND